MKKTTIAMTLEEIRTTQMALYGLCGRNFIPLLALYAELDRAAARLEAKS